MDPGDRRDRFTEGAVWRNNRGDYGQGFLVCWTLNRLFGLSSAPARFIIAW
jgi:hypothetical protein